MGIGKRGKKKKRLFFGFVIVVLNSTGSGCVWIGLVMNYVI